MVKQITMLLLMLILSSAKVSASSSHLILRAVVPSVLNTNYYLQQASFSILNGLELPVTAKIKLGHQKSTNQGPEYLVISVN